MEIFTFWCSSAYYTNVASLCHSPLAAATPNPLFVIFVTSSHTGMSHSDIWLPPVAGSSCSFHHCSCCLRTAGWLSQIYQQMRKVDRCMFKWVGIRVSQAEGTCLFIRAFPSREPFCDLSFCNYPHHSERAVWYFTYSCPKTLEEGTRIPLNFL